jgi:hypothetical protein
LRDCRIGRHRYEGVEVRQQFYAAARGAAYVNRFDLSGSYELSKRPDIVVSQIDIILQDISPVN